MVIYACLGSGKSQQEEDQTYDHKTSLVRRRSLLWDPSCPIKKLPLADASSALFMGGTGGQRLRHVFSCTGKRVWREAEGEDPGEVHPQVFWRRFNEQCVSAKTFDKLDDNQHSKVTEKMFSLISSLVSSLFFSTFTHIFSSTLSVM